MVHTLIFLDIDGVINTTNYRIWLKNNGYSTNNIDMEFDPEAMKNLKEVVDTFNAKIILSSTWRFGLAEIVEDTKDLSCRNLINRLAEIGLKIYGKTPVFGERGKEILKYIEMYAKANNIDEKDIAYIVLDDDSFDIEPYIKPALFIKTDHTTGFDNRCVEVALYSLRKQVDLIEKNIKLDKKQNIFETKQESREAYKKYVQEHIENVQKAFAMFGVYLVSYLESRVGRENRGWLINAVKTNIRDHDKSKFGTIEFDAYAAKFYPCKEDIERGAKAIEDEFQKAWEHHYKYNNHHPEHWKIHLDDGDVYSNMSTDALMEMILDWISVSMTYKTSTYDWWFSNPSGRAEKVTMLNENIIKIIDDIMKDFKKEFDFSEGKAS